MNEHKQKLEIEMEENKNRKIKEAKEANRKHFNDTIDRLNKKVGEKQRELDKKSEENRKMTAKIKQLQEYMSVFGTFSVEQMYNNINQT